VALTAVELAADHEAPGRGSTAVVVLVVSGTAGVWKTALALRWAHRGRWRRTRRRPTNPSLATLTVLMSRR
jgi:hypothetical protein